MLGGCSLLDVLEQLSGTSPAYLYDLDGISTTARSLVDALRPQDLVAYAVKANSAGSVLKTLSALGVGADVVSGGELQLALQTGFSSSNIVMSGVAKQDSELALALDSNIFSIQVESVEELRRVAALAQRKGTRARVSLRINPAVSISSHAHIATGHDKAKFGLPRDTWAQALEVATQSEHLTLCGVSCHVGSMLRNSEPYLQSARVVCEVARDFLSKGHSLSFVDFGGGFGIPDGSETQEHVPAEFARSARELLQEEGLSELRLVIEPGRCVVGPFGVLLARVVQSKQGTHRRWLMLDAGMNDLIRPALYHARHRVEALACAPEGEAWQVVGPVCESSDDFGTHVVSSEVPSHVVIRDCGAYGFTLASEYNGRALPAEGFIRGGTLVSLSQSPGVSRWIASRLDA